MTRLIPFALGLTIGTLAGWWLGYVGLPFVTVDEMEE